MRVLYPLPPSPGPKPARWRWLAKRRWKKAVAERQLVKMHNFPILYGSTRGDVGTGPRIMLRGDHAIFIELAWTREKYEQICPPGRYK